MKQYAHAIAFAVGMYLMIVGVAVTLALVSFWFGVGWLLLCAAVLMGLAVTRYREPAIDWSAVGYYKEDPPITNDEIKRRYQEGKDYHWLLAHGIDPN